MKKRKPNHPGKILEELYIKPLDLNLQKLADRLLITRNTLFKIRSGKASITPFLAIALSEAFDTTPQLWLNLQQTYDLWVEEQEYEHDFIQPIIKNGKFVSIKQNEEILRRAHA
ncbi:MAG: HigA family addiction module antidote protein [Chlamydiia bacterium]|nr:HigA family addiction module antidote protein [Simkania sp.]MCB1081698.1 HigA family addiction module antidote protein [Chlamydiia bacterium]